jgi:rhodanese-related sulfurtransferase
LSGSHQIPWPQLESAISLTEAEFEAKYGFPKPSIDAKIVTHCIGGGRAGKSEALLQQHGFGNVKAYPGSFSDWAKQGGPVEKI